MNLSHLANRNYAEPGRIAYNSAMYIAIEEHNGKEMIVCRPHARFLENQEFMSIFANQGKATESYTNPQCIRYVSYDSDDRGPFWYMTPGKFISLAQLMVDKSGRRLDEKWVGETIEGLLETTRYVNSLGHYTLELTPNSVLVTKDALNQIVLMPPLTDFLPIKNQIWPTENEQLAPELFNIEEPDQRADIYGVGRIIQYLHPYPSLPYKYAGVVKKATSEKVGDRPANAPTMQMVISSRSKTASVTKIVSSIAVVVALFMFMIFYPWSSEPEHEFQDLIGADSTLFHDDVLSKSTSLDPLVNMDIQSATEAEKERILDDYLHDSTYMSMDTAYSLSPEMKEYQKQMMNLAAEKFRTAFKIQARPILQKVYLKENMVSQEKFIEMSNQANTQLINLQTALTKQYQLDPTTANRITAEVYDEVVDALKAAMNK